MKKLLFISILLASFIGAQSVQAQTQTIKTVFDTVQGLDSVYLEIPTSGAYQTLASDLRCDQLGGTSDGTVTIQAAIDTTWYTISPAGFNNAESVTANTISNDSLTIVDEATWYLEFSQPAAKKYRYKVKGTASDTTLVTIKYYLK